MFDLTKAKDTALHRAALNGHLPMVEHLVKITGFDVKDKNKVWTVFPLGALLGALSIHVCHNVQYHIPQFTCVSNDWYIRIIISLCSPT